MYQSMCAAGPPDDFARLERPFSVAPSAFTVAPSASSSAGDAAEPGSSGTPARRISDWQPAASAELQRGASGALGRAVSFGSTQSEGSGGAPRGAGRLGAPEVAELAALLRDAAPFFDHVPMHLLRAHLASLQLVKALPGESFVRAGDFCEGVWVVVLGVARLEPAPEDRARGAAPRDVYPGTGSAEFLAEARTGAAARASLVAHGGACEAVFVSAETLRRLVPPPSPVLPPGAAEAALEAGARPAAERSARDAAALARFLSEHQALFGSPLQRLPPHVLAQVAAAAEVAEVPAARALCVQEAEAHAWLTVLRGTVAVHSLGSKARAAMGKGTVGGEGGRQGACFRVAHPGESLCATAFIFEGLNPVTAVAREACAVLAVRRERLSSDVIDHLAAAAARMPQRLELLRLPPPARADLDILNIFSSMRGRPTPLPCPCCRFTKKLRPMLHPRPETPYHRSTQCLPCGAMRQATRSSRRWTTSCCRSSRPSRASTRPAPKST